MIYGIVLCGGSGTRLWPASSSQKPKQFLNLTHEKNSLLEETLLRLEPFIPQEKRWLVLSAQHQKEAQKLTSHLTGRFLIEPEARNTAPALIYAACEIYQENKEAVMVVVSSDHVIFPQEHFQKTIEKAIEEAREDKFAIIGIPPTHPATGYGYIQKGKQIKNEVFEVTHFKEKPQENIAQEYLKSGEYLWNAGIFVWKVSTFFKELEKINPTLFLLAQKILQKKPLEEVYPQFPKTPIDIAFVEKASQVVCIPALFQWNDIGNWKSLLEIKQKKPQENILKGDVIEESCENCLVLGDQSKIVLVGMKNTAIVQVKDSLLVINLEHEQNLKEALLKVKEKYPEIL